MTAPLYTHYKYVHAEKVITGYHQKGMGRREKVIFISFNSLVILSRDLPKKKKRKELSDTLDMMMTTFNERRK